MACANTSALPALAVSYGPSYRLRLGHLQGHSRPFSRDGPLGRLSRSSGRRVRRIPPPALNPADAPLGFRLVSSFEYLALSIECWLVKLIGHSSHACIHHSDRREEMSWNWSSGVTLWNRLHHTGKIPVSQKSITIGFQPIGILIKSPFLTLFSCRLTSSLRPGRLSKKHSESHSTEGNPAGHLISYRSPFSFAPFRVEISWCFESTCAS